ncbi:MAG: class I SAM-dependent methyltransferase [Oscillospiraceae bacterium]
MDWKKESEMFNQMADYYNEYRPNYPSEIIDTIVKRANLSAGSKLLKIGSCSGKATAQFADFEFNMLCIDPGADLVKKGNERFKGKNISFVVSRFEDYNAPLEYFDAIISAQAFHWIPKPAGYEKCARTLKNGAYLAPFWNIEMIKDTDFDKALLEIMYKYNAFTSSIPEVDYNKRMESISNEIAQSGFFSHLEVFHSHWEKDYSAAEYFGFVSTGNVFVQNTDEIKKACYEELNQLAARYNGIIKRHYICELYVAKKL